MSLRITQITEVWYNPACQLRHIISARRLTRQYLSKITFGLSASKHNVAVLRWKGSYFSWFLYSAIYSIGLFIYSIIQAVFEFISSRKESDIPSAFAPVFGWWSAMRTMFRMDKKARNKFLGGVVSNKL